LFIIAGYFPPLGKAPLESEVDALLETVGDGPVDFKTFKGLYSRKMKKPFELEADMRQAFRSLDNSGNGMISETDLRVLLGTLGEPMDNTDVSLFHPFDYEFAESVS